MSSLSQLLGKLRKVKRGFPEKVRPLRRVAIDPASCYGILRMSKRKITRAYGTRNIPDGDRRTALSQSDKEILAKLSRAAKGGLISIPSAAEAMEIPSERAALKLATLARRGWLLRARRGLYLILPLEAHPNRPSVAEDPWVLAREAFSPCYIGGWSAAEHWGLTEQLFRSTVVVTAAHIRHRTVTLLGHDYRLFRVPPSRIKGSLVPVWRGAEQVLVSSRERTIADGLRHPHLCGGVRSVFDLLAAYKESPECKLSVLTSVMQEGGSGAAWKRLGYFTEILWPQEKAFLREIRAYLTAGNVRLDPSVSRRGTLVRRWRLWVNVKVKEEGRPSSL